MNTMIYAIAGGIEAEIKQISDGYPVRIDKIDLDIERERVNIVASSALQTTVFAIDADSVEVWNWGFAVRFATHHMRAPLSDVKDYASFILTVARIRDADTEE